MRRRFRRYLVNLVIEALEVRDRRRLEERQAFRMGKQAHSRDQARRMWYLVEGGWRK